VTRDYEYYNRVAGLFEAKT